MAAEVVAQTGGVFVHPSDDVLVISGQGTVGLEMVEQVRQEYGVSLDAVVVPVGGGGLISGITTAVKGIDPSIIVLGAEPKVFGGVVQFGFPLIFFLFFPSNMDSFLPSLPFPSHPII